MAATAIGFWGGMALLISSITGPGLTTSQDTSPLEKLDICADELEVPLLFQEAGWLTLVLT